MNYPVVRLLQTTNSVPIQWRHARRSARRGLLSVEQCRGHPLLPVQLVQGWRNGADPPGLAQDLGPQRHRPHRPHLHLLLWVLRLQKRSPFHVRVPIWGKPHVQDKPTLGLLLVLSKMFQLHTQLFCKLATLFSL